MKKLISLCLLACLILLAPNTGFSKKLNGLTQKKSPIGETALDGSVKKWNVSGTADASMFQLALLELGGQSSLSTLRYSLFFNTGFQLNRTLTKNMQIFSGINIKNLGLIYRTDSFVQKYRSYTIGAPLGLKIGKLKSQYLVVGGGVDFPFHSKKKQWDKGDRGSKVKSRKWFSNEVNSTLVYGFLGYRFKGGLTLKAFYYPTNYWSDSFVPGNASNIVMLTLGMDVGRNSSGKSFKFNPKKKLKTANP
jgi:hypothetical protein